MEAVHFVHRGVGAHFHVSPLQLQLDSAQIGQGDNAGKYVTPDLAIGPMPHRHQADEVIILALPEAIFHRIPVQAGPDDLVGCPVHVVGNDNVFSESIDIPVDPVMILSASHAQSAMVMIQFHRVQIRG